MSSKKAAKAAKAAKRSSKLVDAAQVGDVETMARVMSSGGKLDLDVMVVREGWVNVETKEAVPDVHVTALHAAVTIVRLLLDPADRVVRDDPSIILEEVARDE